MWTVYLALSFDAAVQAVCRSVYWSIQNILTTAIEAKAFWASVFTVDFCGDLQHFLVELWQIVLLQNPVDSLKDWLEQNRIRVLALWLILSFWSFKHCFDLYDFVDVYQQFGFVLYGLVTVVRKHFFFQFLRFLLLHHWQVHLNLWNRNLRRSVCLMDLLQLPQNVVRHVECGLNLLLDFKHLLFGWDFVLLLVLLNQVDA
jgi:hypothetical protein